MAPIWHAILQTMSIPFAVITARPKIRASRSDKLATERGSNELLPAIGDEAVIEATAMQVDAAKMIGIIIDDIAFTGVSYLMIERFLFRYGVLRRNIYFSQNAPLLMGVLTSEAKQSLSVNPVLLAPRLGTAPDGDTTMFFSSLLKSAGVDIEVSGVRPLGATYQQRFFAAHVTMPLDQIVHFSPRSVDRKYIVAGMRAGKAVKLVAKLVGIGALVSNDIERTLSLSPVGYDVLGCWGGYLFYEWITGKHFEFDATSLGDDDVNRLAGYVSRLACDDDRFTVSTGEYLEQVLKRVETSFSQLSPVGKRVRSQLSRFTEGLGEYVPMVHAPRNQGHWHHIRDEWGKLRRVHLELGEWSLDIDPAEELAAIQFELMPSEVQMRGIVDAYSLDSGDRDARRRLALGRISYLARVVDNYDFWRARLSQLPSRYRLAKEPATAFKRRELAARHSLLQTLGG